MGEVKVARAVEEGAVEESSELAGATKAVATDIGTTTVKLLADCIAGETMEAVASLAGSGRVSNGTGGAWAAYPEAAGEG